MLSGIMTGASHPGAASSKHQCECNLVKSAINYQMNTQYHQHYQLSNAFVGSHLGMCFTMLLDLLHDIVQEGALC